MLKEMEKRILDIQPQIYDNLVRLIHSEDYDPHHILGLHDLDETRKVIRLWCPGAKSHHLEVSGKIVEAKRIHDAGLFEYIVPKNTGLLDYKVYYKDGSLKYDPYNFLTTFGELDQYLFAHGVHYNIYELMGSHPMTHLGVKGTSFVVWAPSAKRVSLVADFNHWDGRTHPMRALGRSGVWELFVPGIDVGEKYKYEIKTQTNEILIKADPYAFSSEIRPFTASIVSDIESYQWKDSRWIEKRSQEKSTISKPMNIYEVHLGSWKMGEGGKFLNYRELSHELANYCKEMGYTHVELMPISEHPLDESWGYQVSGYYAVTSRFGSPQDFQYFVETLHEHEIGVILDWVPGHFPKDDFSLAVFDGTCLYEHQDPRQGVHPHWNTLIFNFGRKEVLNFLIGNALFWCKKMHVDGLRVDAVASMLYLDYGREEGQWIPNQYGGKENLEAIEFFRHLNSIIHTQVPGALTIAEESTSFAGVTKSVHEGGLGFDYKWNMGWMNDTLRYFSTDMIFRKYHQNDLTFGLLYAFSEKFILVLSHDEVVHGKRHLISKMPGDLWQRFANVRLLLSYMCCQPGKKLLFMGSEVAQWNEWYCKQEVEWHLLKFPYHHGLQSCVKEMNHFYLQHSALWERDTDFTGFEWVDFRDETNSVISYLRKSGSEILLCIHHFTPQYNPHYHIGLSNLKSIVEIFNTDAEKYGGSGKHNATVEIAKDAQGNHVGINIQMAPLATLIFKVQFL